MKIIVLPFLALTLLADPVSKILEVILEDTIERERIVQVFVKMDAGTKTPSIG
jgi:hypothetical protein